MRSLLMATLFRDDDDHGDHGCRCCYCCDCDQKKNGCDDDDDDDAVDECDDHFVVPFLLEDRILRDEHYDCSDRSGCNNKNDDHDADDRLAVASAVPGMNLLRPV
mmetsp:Transcript_38833/g.94010  ORF Transcript_38833/g.94010 Transcript_38833/m.94010 type:complete len:105 (-) Transcript_38833:1022-1336(-)